MFTPAISDGDIQRLVQVLCDLPRRAPLSLNYPPVIRPERVLSVREALLSPSEALPVGECVGRVLAAATVGCPPAVPIVVSGERITEDAIACFQYYGIENCAVVKEQL